ncbi:PTS sugar transporter subunit IIA [Devosia sp. ZB163]|uniref:PTS sugar transporter subunit IIA n=1 Tax=Devosia sp. ZB163 TaxID=3025938 RepID=UPI00235F631D|nr:PTS sugar transporter subunit IIA [Devosia sp. ZB163]MDC9822939.1 PTS sugar transporter subunit IIA [Devosia sp. ZB163]
MELADILSEEAVIVCSGTPNKLEVLQKLATCASSITGQEAATIFDAVNEREQLGSTGLGNGIAIPHGKFAGLTGVTAVFARLEHPIDFESVDDQPVDLVMMLLAPLGAGADHLKALARVARLLRTDSVVARLRRTSDPAELRDILTQPLAQTQAA